MWKENRKSFLCSLKASISVLWLCIRSFSRAKWSVTDETGLDQSELNYPRWRNVGLDHLYVGSHHLLLICIAYTLRANFWAFWYIIEMSALSPNYRAAVLKRVIIKVPSTIKICAKFFCTRGFVVMFVAQIWLCYLHFVINVYSITSLTLHFWQY